MCLLMPASGAPVGNPETPITNHSGTAACVVPITTVANTVVLKLVDGLFATENGRGE